MLNRYYTVLYWLFVFTIIVADSKGISGQEQGLVTINSFDKYDFFDDKEAMICSLEFDIKKFRKNKSKSKYQHAIFQIYDSGNVLSQHHIKIKARGESRKEYCKFPPIKVKFSDADIADPYLNAINNQKLVTHCKQGNEFEQNLLEEYLVYKIYNLLTDFSFRVKLVHITYIDSQGKLKPLKRHAFIIEEAKIVAERNNGFYIKDDDLSMKYIDAECLMQLSLFEFMIGNPDWSISGLHNICLIKSKRPDKPLPFAVPYDFDYTGFVSPVYALIEENSSVMTVEERTFQGICGEADSYKRIIQKFNDHKNAILSTVDEFDQIQTKSRNEMVNYIEDFYDLLNSPKFYEKHILANCKK